MDKKENNRFSGSKTEENLHTALSGESQAYVRYKLFADAAKRIRMKKVGINMFIPHSLRILTSLRMLMYIISK